MDLALWIAVAVPLVLGFAPITNAGTTKIDAARLDRLRGSVRLPLPDRLRDRVVARIRSTEIKAVAGATLGLAVTSLVVALGPDDAGGALVFLGIGVGGGIGSAVGILTVSLAQDPRAPRLARSVAVERHDYVAPDALLLVRGLLVLATLAATVGTIATAQGSFSLRQSVMFVVVPYVGALTCYVALEVLLRVAVARAQRASSELELAWDDVLRVLGLRQTTLSAVVVAAACAISVALGLVTEAGPTSTAVLVTGGVLGVIAIGGGIAAVVALRREPAYRVVGRLWPRPGPRIDPYVG